MTTKRKRDRDRQRRAMEPSPVLTGEQCEACGSWHVLGGSIGRRDERTCLTCGLTWEADR